MLEGLTVSRAAFLRTIRLVSTARLRPAVLSALVGAEDLAALAEIEGATSNRLLAQQRGAGGVTPFEMVYGVPHAAFINASFAYAKPRQPSRFSNAERGAWYAALEVETSMAEVAFHMTAMLAETGRFRAVVEYAGLFADFAGAFLDLRPHPAHPCLNSEKALGYPVGNALADAARARGLSGIIYPSVRRAGGTCLAALSPHAVQSVTQGAVYRFTWQDAPEPRIEALC